MAMDGTMDTSERWIQVVYVPQDLTQPVSEVKIHQKKGEALKCLIDHCKKHFAKNTLKGSQLDVFRQQVSEHSKGQEVSEQLLAQLAQSTTCDMIVLHPNKPETKFISINMYVDDKGVSKELGLNVRATSIANECGKPIQVIGDAFIGKQFDDENGFYRYDFTTKDLNTSLPWFKVAKELNTRAQQQAPATVQKMKSFVDGSGTGKANKATEKAYRERTQGNNSFKKGKYNAAITHYTRCLEALGITETSEPAKSADEIIPKVYSNISACYAKLQDFPKAEKNASRCIEYKPDWAKGWGRLYDAQIGQGKTEEAKNALKKALELAPDSPDLLARKKQVESSEKAVK